MNVIDNKAVRGILAGAVATVPMAITFNQFGSTTPADTMHGASGLSTRGRKDRITNSTHLVSGAFFGLLFSLTTSRIHRYPTWLKGVLFGAGIWALSRTEVASSLALEPAQRNASLPSVNSYSTRTFGPNSKSAGFESLLGYLIWGLAAGRLVEQSPSMIVREAASGMLRQGMSSKIANALVRG